MQRIIHHLIAFLNCWIYFGGMSAYAHEDWHARFLQEGLAAWKQYQAEATNLQGTYTRKVIDPSSGKVLRENHHEIKQAESCALHRYQQHMDICNPQYGFQLSRRSAEGAWVLEGCDRKNSEAEPIRQIVGVHATYGLALYALTNYLPTMMAEPGMKITGVTPETRNGITLVKVSFQRTVKDWNVGPVVRGDLWLRPDRYWLLEEFEVVQEYYKTASQILPEKWKGKVEYVLLPDGFPVVKSHVFKTDGADGKATPLESRFDFQLTRQKLTEADFTLTAFGFPEPPGVNWERPTPWYLWVGGIAITFLIMGFLIKRFAWRSPTVA